MIAGSSVRQVGSHTSCRRKNRPLTRRAERERRRYCAASPERRRRERREQRPPRSSTPCRCPSGHRRCTEGQRHGDVGGRRETPARRARGRRKGSAASAWGPAPAVAGVCGRSPMYGAAVWKRLQKDSRNEWRREPRRRRRTATHGRRRGHGAEQGAENRAGAWAIIGAWPSSS